MTGRTASDRATRPALRGPQLAEVEARKKVKEKEKARASTTDPEARVMKMGNGGFRPAHNVQFATDTASQVITGVDAVNTGNDQGQMVPMIERHEQRHGRAPQTYPGLAFVYIRHSGETPTPTPCEARISAMARRNVGP